MAARNLGKGQSTTLNIPFEQIEKTSSTLKRHPKMELSKPDLLQLLGVLEGELQAREIVIAVLKAEQVKQLLYPSKKRTLNDPIGALQRDSYGAFDTTLDEASVKNLHNMQLSQLENFIRQQKNAQMKLKEQLQEAEERCEKIHSTQKYEKLGIMYLAELEEEKRKHAQDTAQGDDVTYLLEKERERLRQENEFERQQNRSMEKELKCLTETLEQERQRHKQMVLLLLAERKRLILRYVEEKQKSERLSQILCDEKGRIADMVDGLEEESKKSLQMEAEMERQLCEFEMERDQFKAEMAAVEARNSELQIEVQKLQEEIEILKKQAAAAAAQAQLGEGVRSAIVTMVSTPAIRAAPTVSPTVSPPRGVARAVMVKVGPAPATPAKPPGLIPQGVNKPPCAAPPKPATAVIPSSVSGTVTAQPIVSSVKSPRPEKAVGVPGTLPVSSDQSESQAMLGSQFADNIVSPSEVAKSGAPVNDIAVSSQKAVTPVKVGGKSPGVLPSPAAKKALPIGRGTPPPIPPNKPVLPPQALHRKDSSVKPPVPPRTELVAEGGSDPKKPGGLAARYGVIQSKQASLEERMSSVAANKEEVQVGVPSEIKGALPSVLTTTNCSGLPSVATSVNSDISVVDSNLSSEALGQELADFQEVLVSMVSNKVSDEPR